MPPGPGDLALCWLPPATPTTGALRAAVGAFGEAMVVGVPRGAPTQHGPDGSPVELPSGATIAHLANIAAARFPGLDLALATTAELPRGDWARQLTATSRRDGTVASISALTTTDVDVGPDLGAALKAGVATDGEDELPRPRLAGSRSPCVVIGAGAVALLGPLDEGLRSSAAAILEFSLRACERGLANVLSTDLLVADGGAFTLDAADREVLEQRYPSLFAACEEIDTPALERAKLRATVEREPLTVTLDARALGPRVGGTQEYVLQLITALATREDVRLRALVAPDQTAATKQTLTSIPRVELLEFEDALQPDVSATHVVHRPQQVFTEGDLPLLRPLGGRLVITHQDLIAYHNPTYFAGHDDWQRYVRVTRAALGAADHILFFSVYAHADAVREDLVEMGRASVVGLGSDPTTIWATEEREPDALRAVGDRPFVLQLGADYWHKNRVFSLRLLEQLNRVGAWDGVLVFAGPHVPHGSSAAEERDITTRDLGSVVIDLGVVSEAERRWLMRNTAAVIYPTVDEGFGLVPFEAAKHGVPCLFAAQSALLELLPAEHALLTGWDVVASAERCAAVLTGGTQREQHVAALVAAAAPFTWSATAAGTVAAYHAALGSPQRASAQDAWLALEREAHIARLATAYDQVSVDLKQLHDAHEIINARLAHYEGDGQALVGPDGYLSPEDQHALLAVAARPAMRRATFAALRALYRASHAVRPRPH